MCQTERCRCTQEINEPLYYPCQNQSLLLQISKFASKKVIRVISHLQDNKPELKMIIF